MSNKSLTIVLPVYNGESRLTHHVTEMLELASELTSHFEVMIVDDGSTDDTSAVAQELATQYPQISVRRHRHRRGLGPIISMVQRRVSTDVVIVHDGVTPINSVEVRRLWQQSAAETKSSRSAAAAGANPKTLDVHASWRAFARLTPPWRSHTNASWAFICFSPCVKRRLRSRPTPCRHTAKLSAETSRPTDQVGSRPDSADAATEFSLGDGRLCSRRVVGLHAATESHARKSTRCQRLVPVRTIHHVSSSHRSAGNRLPQPLSKVCAISLQFIAQNCSST